MAEEFFDKLGTLPEAVQDYLFSDALSAANLSIIDKYKFSEKEKEVFFDIINKIFFKELSLGSLTSVMYGQFGIKDDKTMKELEAEMKTRIFMPMAEYLGIEGGKEDKEIELVEKAIKKFNLSFDGVARKRFAEAAESFLNGARTKTQLKNTLMKDAANGGLGMEKISAGDVADFLASYARIAELENSKKQDARTETIGYRKSNSEAPASAIGAIPATRPSESGLSGEQPVFTEAAKEETSGRRYDLPATSYRLQAEVSFSAEEKEVAGLARKVERLKKTAGESGGKIEEIMGELGITFPSDELAKRFRGIIDSRVRAVRTGIQTLEAMIAPVSSGGMGFTKEEADKISLELNKYLDAANKDLYQTKIAEIKLAEDTEKKREEEKKQTEEDARKKVLDDKFFKLTGKPAPAMPASAPVVASAREVIPPAFLKETIGRPTSDGRQTSSNNTIKKKSGGFMNFLGKIFPVFQKNGGVVSEKVKLEPAMPEKKAVAKDNEAAPPSRATSYKLSSASSPSLVRPVVEDIKFTPKLFGPLEEIGRMTVDDFRKLGSDPRERIRKIEDKLQLLREESFKKYQSGIEAWKKSPVYGEALSIINKTITEGADLMGAIKSSGSLSQEEFDAIINSRIGD